MFKPNDENKLLFSPRFLKQKEYWINRLSGEFSKTEIAFVDREEHTSWKDREPVAVHFPGELTNRLMKLSKLSDLSLYILLLTGVKILIHHYTGNDDVTVVSPLHRFKISEETSNSLVFIRDQLNGDLSVKALILKIRASVLEAYANQDYPFERLLDYLFNTPDAAAAPLTGIVCALRNIHTNEYRPVLEGKCELSFSFAKEGETLSGQIQYDSDRCAGYYVQRMAMHFINILEQVVEDVGVKIFNISITANEEKRQLLWEFNDTQAPYPKKKTLHRLFEEQVENRADKTVLVFNNRRLNYLEVNKKANRLAVRLRAKGVKAEDPVGIIASRSFEMIVGILGILKAGGAYLPIDPEYPDERIQYILEDCNAEIVLIQSNLKKKDSYNRENISLDVELLTEGEDKNIQNVNNVKNLAYIMYTSGSTGKPKGVMVEHQSVVRLVKNTNFVELTEETRILQTGAPVFDATTFEIWGSLLNGGRLYLVEDDVILDAHRLGSLLVKEKINTLWLTSPLFNQLTAQNEDIFSNLECLIVGGDVLAPKYINIVRNKSKQLRIVNGYGPTENTTFSTYYFIEEDFKNRIPIGSPISNSTVYVLNQYLHPQPIGVTGELYVGGDGISRGYLNSPQLTEEKFIKNPFGEGDLLYKTGDLVRWLPDGNLEFLGRKDYQVKIRGYRIELGEIESRLQKHEEIKEALVIVMDIDKDVSINENPEAVEHTGTGNKVLCAYIVLEKGANQSTGGLREYLLKELPDYMVPPYFVVLDEFPLTPNGKIDRKMLPDPGDAAQGGPSECAAPRNSIELKLVEICNKVLGRRITSIHDNFFEIGGDSIKAIQIASRMYQAGYKIDVADIFQYPLISELAPRVRKPEKTAAQGVITGEIPLTPIMTAFFSSPRREPHHFNQAVLLYSREEIEEEAIRAVFSKIQEHHDALRMVYRECEGKIIQSNLGLEYPFSLQVYDFRNHQNALAVMEDRINKLQTSINLEKGPLMNLGLFHLEDGDRLLITIHHFVIDTVSWRILFEDIETLYQQFKKGEPLVLPSKTDSFKIWSEGLSEYADSRTLLEEKSFWMELEASDVPLIKKDFLGGDNFQKDTEILTFSLGEEETERLLSQVNDPFGTEINDILLTALGLGIQNVFGNQKLLIALEGHGREEVLKDVNIKRTVGWFTSVYPVLLNFSTHGDLARQIIEIKETLRRIPNKGIGYGILKYLTADENKKEIDFRLAPQVSFNYLGQFDADVEQMSFEVAKESSGLPVSPIEQREYELDVSGMVVKKRLVMSITYNKGQYRSETVNKLLNQFQAALSHIISFCSSRQKKELTPSDLTYKKLSIDELEQLKVLYNVEDICRLTPMQEGMLFHSLYEKGTRTDFVQISFTLQGELDLSLVEKSINVLFKRHDILRTVFLYEKLNRPLQVVLTERRVDFYSEDIRRIGGEKEKKRYLEVFKEKDRQNTFDLSKDVLVRLAVIRMEDRNYTFVWSFHHILTDGWCTGILISEFFDIYNSYMSGRVPRLPEVKPYRTYIQWLDKQDKKGSKIYWTKYLEFYEEGVSIPEMKAHESDKSRNVSGKVVFELNRERTGALNWLAGKNHVTLNTVIQTVWGIILGKYNRKEDVVFGVVVSGRPSEIEGIESMVGLFINTIPLRIRFERNTKFNRLLQTVQERAIDSELYHYYPLAEIQSQSILKQNLLDHILVFENYPVAEYIKGIASKGGGKGAAFQLSNVQVFDQTNYDFIIVIAPQERLIIRLEYNARVYERRFAENIINHFNSIFDQVIENGELPIKEITLLSAEEKKQVLLDFNDTTSDYPVGKPLHLLFEEQVKRAPHHTAAVGTVAGAANKRNMLYISYKELNERANHLAILLQNRGIKSGSIVALMVDRCIEMVIGLLGILKAGGAYLPLDPCWPSKRIKFMLADGNVRHVLVHGTAPFDVEDTLEVINLKSCRVFSKEPEFQGVGVPNLQFAGSSTNLAYIIYTSGTTGEPKGVAVEHKSAVNVIIWFGRQYRVKSGMHVLLMSDYTFDASVNQIFATLVHGSTLYVISKELLMNVNALRKYIEVNEINLINFVPALLNELLSHWKKPGSLNTVISGAEKLDDSIKSMILEKGYNLYNHYGPTETTIDALASKCSRGKGNLGRPISNAQCYILDKFGDILSVGIPGELVVSGAGVARGYLNQPELTWEKFTVNPYLPGQKLYWTGDLGRWLPDGNIEFLGRIDHQVKIKGFRIELEEIENRLVTHDSIKTAVVTAGEDETRNKYLCAYILWEGDEAIKIPKLKDYLAKTLPSYMIPSYFVVLDKFPLTSNGKIDRKALPTPDGAGVEISSQYEAPVGKIEKILVEIWEKLLRRNPIGVNENFFEIGGDSIKAIQLTSRLQGHQLKLEIKDLFAHPTIKQVSKRVRPIKRKINQGIVEGEVALTPIQHHFFEKNLIHSHHFNQSLMIYSRNGFDETILKKVFTKIVEHHDSLRMVYWMEDEPIVQVNRGMDGRLLDLQVVNFKDNGDIEDEITKKANRIQRTINLGSGPLVKLALFKTKEGDHLLIVIHHLVVDGVSWRILLEDFAGGYWQAAEGEEIRFQEKTDSYKYWSQKLKEYSENRKALREVEYWEKLEETPVEKLPVDHKTGREKKKRKFIKIVRMDLSKVETMQLLRDSNRTYNTEINDLLLAALGMTLKEWAGMERVVINLEGHGREAVIEDIDVSRTVGWFTSCFPVILDMNGADDLAYGIKSIKETLRKIPNRGIGYGVLRYLTPEDKRDRLNFNLKPEINFNYLGQFGEPDDNSNGERLFEMSQMSGGEGVSPEAEQSFTLDINGILRDGRLSLFFSYNRYEYNRRSIEKLVDRYKSTLIEIIHHCRKKKEKELTPSDVGYKNISIRNFAAITDYIKTLDDNSQIQRIYLLTPMQQGMLYHCLKDETSTTYFQQNQFLIKGELVKPLLERSINKIVDRYDILRTVFVYKVMDEPLQVVLKEREVSLYYEDISGCRDKEKENYLEEFLRRDKEQGFELSKDMLLRISLFKMGEDSYKLVWSFHHILLDGWCMEILFKELLQIYQALKQEEPIRLPEVPPYIKYIEWLEQQDQEEGLKYWQKYLEGYQKQASLPQSRKSVKANGYQLEEHRLLVGAAKAEGLTRIARQNQVTINTLFQTLWGLLLQKYNNSDDVVYGAVVSGRPPEVEGIENMVGLFINTVPLRIKKEKNQDFPDLLKKVQQQAGSSKPYEYLPLAKIQENSLLKRDLINHILTFENYPIQEELEKVNIEKKTGLTIEIPGSYEQTNYDFNIVICPGETILVKFSFNSLVYEIDHVKTIASQFEEMIKQVLENPVIAANDVGGISKEKRAEQLLQLGQDLKEEVGLITRNNKTLQSRLYESFDKFKDNTAIEYGDKSITYTQLNHLSNHIANRIIDKGIKKQTAIGILMDNRIQFICTIIGILKAGCLFVPLDFSYPRDRIDLMIKSMGIEFVIIANQNLSKFRAIDAVEFIPVDELIGKEESPLQTEKPFVACSGEDEIYIYFTSGSTGTPRAFIGRNESLLHFIDWEIETFDINETFHISQFTNPGFDAFLRDIFTPLCSGGIICVPDQKDTLINSKDLIRWMDRNRINLIHCVPSLFRLMSSGSLKKDNFKALKCILMSGEKIEPSELVNWYACFGDRIKLINLWGTSETTLAKTYYPIEKSDVTRIRMPVGKAIRGARVMVLGENMELCDELVTGELYISTPFRTFGYCNDPWLNRERFIQNPFHSNPDDLIHKSGDLGRLLPDGNIELLGRNDRQVKVRGIRVELEEIESVMMNHTLVKEAVAIKTKISKNNDMLCAYATQKWENSMEKKTFLSDLRDYLSEKLPDYMVPSNIMMLEQIPRNTNGKVDYERLAYLAVKEKIDFTQPGNEMERKLLELWSEILGIEQVKISVTKPFFELGGNSLNIMTLISRIHREFDIRITLAEVFNNSTIRQQAEIIAGETQKVRYTSIRPVEKKEHYVLSSAQKRLYVIQHMELQNTAYNMLQTLILEGEVDKKRLQGAFAALIRRHEILRTSFHLAAGQPFQKIHDNVRFEIEYSDAEEISQGSVETGYSRPGETGETPVALPPAEGQAKHLAGIIKKFVRPFELSQAPLLRMGLTRLHSRKHLLVLDMHHIIADGVSYRVLIEDFMALYKGEQLPELSVQYKDFSEWRNCEPLMEAYDEQQKYWVNHLEGEIPILNIPIDYPRPGIQSFEGSTEKFEIGIQITRALNDLVMKENTTLYILLVAVFNVLLAKLSGQEDILIGTPTAGRRHADLENLIGMFVNTLVLRNQPQREIYFDHFLRSVKENTLKAFENQEYPFEDLLEVEALNVKREPGRNPLFDIMFVMQNIRIPEMQIPSLTLLPYEFKGEISKFDLTLLAMEAVERLSFTFEYATKLFKRETIQRFAHYFKKMLCVITQSPHIKLSEIEIIDEEEKQKILYQFNRSRKAYPRESTVHQLFEEQAMRNPDNIAVVYIGDGTPGTAGPENITYRQLNDRINQLAALLKNRGIGPGSVTAVMLAPTPEMIIVILAVLKTGGAYLPIDIHCPPNRIMWMLKQSRVSILLSSRSIIEMKALPLASLKSQIFLVDKFKDTLHAQSIENPTYIPGTHDLIYIIFTSGSTGKPKGAGVYHRGFMNLMHWFVAEFELNSYHGNLLLTSLSFDLTQKNLYAPLITGGTLYLPGLEHFDPPVHLQQIYHHKITWLNCTPGMFYKLVEVENSKERGHLSSLRYVFLGGEPISMSLLIDWLVSDRCRAEIINTYGPTECTDICASYRVTGPLRFTKAAVPIGKPNYNAQLYVVDQSLKIVPIGVSGELLIGGEGVGIGYINDKSLTEQKFLYLSPAPGEPKQLLYRTGDLVKWRADGNIEYIGRIDQQVKMRGFRIEPGEIENQLLKHEEIAQAVVTTKGNNRDGVLCAYIVAHEKLTASIPQLKDFLSRELPHYMIPSHFVQVKKIPLNPNGKVDRKALEAYGTQLSSGPDFIAPTSEKEKLIALLWQDVLQVEKVGLNDNFFDIGGNSLKVITLAGKLTAALKIDIPVAVLFERYTIASFLRYLEDLEVTDSISGEEDERTEIIDKVKESRQKRRARRRIGGEINV
jgi:amino acid adenylation domain-containing protein/non-ribosomal peptide synthase protein (TIGR01720 family)